MVELIGLALLTSDVRTVLPGFQRLCRGELYGEVCEVGGGVVAVDENTSQRECVLNWFKLCANLFSWLISGLMSGFTSFKSGTVASKSKSPGTVCSFKSTLNILVGSSAATCTSESSSRQVGCWRYSCGVRKPFGSKPKRWSVAT